MCSIVLLILPFYPYFFLGVAAGNEKDSSSIKSQDSDGSSDEQGISYCYSRFVSVMNKML